LLNLPIASQALLTKVNSIDCVLTRAWVNNAEYIRKSRERIRSYAIKKCSVKV